MKHLRFLALLLAAALLIGFVPVINEAKADEALPYWIGVDVKNQLDGVGFSFIELLTNCPTTWHTDPLGSLDFMEKYTEKYFECKVFADREGRFWE